MTARTPSPLVVTALVTGLAGCLSVPEGPEPMCHASSDCDRSRGEVCEEGVCWGDPPPGPFAAVISPPSTRQDLVSRELPQVAIPDFGWMGDLALETPVLLGGKLAVFCPPPLAACDPTPLGGTVTVSRASLFHGGPGFNTVANVAAGDSFTIPVRRSQPDDALYTVTIVPDSTRQLGSRSAAEIVPPRRMQVTVSDNTNIQTIALGGADLPVITGTLRDSAGAGIANYRVSALGRWDPTEPATEVSTIDYTDATGAFSIALSDELVGTVELIARPVPDKLDDPPPTAPTIHSPGIDATRSSTRSVVAPADLGRPAQLVLQIQALNDSGEIVAVSGAQVSIAGARADALNSFTMTDEKVANADGKVMLNLLDGAGIAGTYRMSITPPAGSSFGVLFDQKASLQMPQQVRLGSRIALRGRVIGLDDKPVSNVAVTARPSLRFLWTLDAASQAFAASIPAATAVTLPTGDFRVWVDQNIAQTWGHYDLLIEPPTGAQAPDLTVSEFEIVRNASLDAVTVGDVVLPQASYVHGRITGPDGRSVEDAELKLYRLSTQLTLCSEVAHAPASCPIPAQLQARNTSDSDGTVRLALPR
ncbi:MAG TPA: hypothetical protein VK607_05260 [Kofleriaceae bacterium]|nr:hypothetical protein [Kofleriaceae bacterium]